MQTYIYYIMHIRYIYIYTVYTTNPQKGAAFPNQQSSPKKPMPKQVTLLHWHLTLLTWRETNWTSGDPKNPRNAPVVFGLIMGSILFFHNSSIKAWDFSRRGGTGGTGVCIGERWVSTWTSQLHWCPLANVIVIVQLLENEIQNSSWLEVIKCESFWSNVLGSCKIFKNSYCQ